MKTVTVETKMIKLVDSEIAIIKQFNQVEMKRNLGSSQLLDMYLSIMATNSGVAYKILRSDIKAYLTQLITDNNVMRRALTILDLATKYNKYKLDIVIDKETTYFYNVESIINVMSYIADNEDKCTIKFKEAKELLKIDTKLSTKDYNNTLADVIKNIKKQNKIIESEVGVIKFSYSNVYKQLQDNLDKLSNDDRINLIALLQSSSSNN